MKEIDDSKLLLDVAPNNYLDLIDKSKIKSLVGLAGSLKTMPDDVFGYHVNFQRNDFSEWIKDIIKDNQLAEIISKAEGSHEMARLIEDRLSKIKNRDDLLKKLIDQKEKLSVKANEDRKKSEEDIIKKKLEEKNKGKEKKLILIAERRRIKEEKRKVRQIEKQRKVEEKRGKKGEKRLRGRKGMVETGKKYGAEGRGKKLIEQEQKLIEEILKGEKEILQKEREIEFREKKMQEVEERIEKKLDAAAKKQKDTVFSKDFVQGIIVGILIVALIIVIYWKFFF